MTSPNPYAPPKADIAEVSVATEVDIDRMDRIASGQRIVIASFAVQLLGRAAQAEISGNGAVAIALLVLAMAIYGIVRLQGALQGSVLSRVLCACAMGVPLVNLLVMLMLSGRATKVLRGAGYKVGLLGARRRDGA